MQHPETKEYMIVMEYANNGSLLSYLDRNINNLTWRMKIQLLETIANHLHHIHLSGYVHCDLHGGNIVLHNNNPFICNFCLSQQCELNIKSTVQGSLPFIAPEVLHTCKFTQQSDIYSFGIIMYLMATGEAPFQDRQFNRDCL